MKRLTVEALATVPVTGHGDLTLWRRADGRRFVSWQEGEDLRVLDYEQFREACVTGAAALRRQEMARMWRIGVAWLLRLVKHRGAASARAA